MQSSKPELVIPYLEKALELNPLGASTISILAVASKLTGDETNSDKYYRKILALPQIRLFSRMSQFLIWLVDQDEIETARKIMAEMESEYGSNFRTAQRTILAKEGKFDEIREQIKDLTGWGSTLYYSALLGDTSKLAVAVKEIPRNRDFSPIFDLPPLNLYKNLPEVQEFLAEQGKLHKEESERFQKIIDRVLSGKIDY